MEVDSSESATDSGCLLLHEIAAKNDVQLLSKLLSFLQTQGVTINLNQKNEKGQTPLHVAAINNRDRSHFELTEILLKNGADPNAKNNYGNPLILWDLVENQANVEILKLFFKFKADFVNVIRFGSSILALATKSCKNLDVIKFLVRDAGLDVNHRNKNGWTPLHYTAYCNKKDSHFEIFEFLLENCADVNTKDNEGRTPLWVLIRLGGNLRVIDLFLKYNPDLHAVNEENGRSILFEFYNGNSDSQALNKLINDFHLDVNHTDKDEYTPLHCIFNSQFSDSLNIGVIKCFVKNGANVNVFSNDGATPLMKNLHDISHDREQKFFLENKISLDFLLEQTDFGVVHNNFYIFYYSYYGEYYQEDEVSLSNYLCEWVLEHLAKLQFLKIQIHPIIQKFIEDHEDYKDYFQECTKELEAMKTSKLQDSWITFFNLLVDSRRKLKNYAGNQNLIKDFKKENFLEKFPIYGASTKKNMKKSIKRRELFDESADLLSDCLPIFSPNHLIVKDILDCILSKKDLSKLCK